MRELKKLRNEEGKTVLSGIDFEISDGEIDLNERLRLAGESCHIRDLLDNFK